MDISYLKIKQTVILVIAFLLIACVPNIDYNITGYTQKIIVEGSIENGKFPMVYLTLNVPLWKSIDSTNVLENVIRHAKVTISDGEQTEVLTSKWDKTKFPPYVYRGTEIVGEEGKSYDLKVEYGGYTVYSKTFLPYGSKIDSVSYTPSIKSDTLKTISVWLNIDKSKKTAFRFFTKKRKDNRFVETAFVFNSSLNLSSTNKFNLSPKPNKTDSSLHEGSFFAIGDTVDIKIMAIDSISSLFFTDLSVYSTIADNMISGEVKPLKSNISSPGFGIWYGSAVNYYRCIVK